MHLSSPLTWDNTLFVSLPFSSSRAFFMLFLLLQLSASAQSNCANCCSIDIHGCALQNHHHRHRHSSMTSGWVIFFQGLQCWILDNRPTDTIACSAVLPPAPRCKDTALAPRSSAGRNAARGSKQDLMKTIDFISNTHLQIWGRNLGSAEEFLFVSLLNV